jgi:DnaJ domain
MGSVPALKAAVDLLHFPSQAAVIRASPLPCGLVVLLRIAAGNEEAIRQMSAAEGRSLEIIREAATFFLEQVLLHPDSDSYRVLGASCEASHAELRQNMSLLLQWLHPDLDRHDPRSVFVARVTRAWNDLKTPERRAAYDRGLRSTPLRNSSPLWTASLRPQSSRRAASDMGLIRRHIRRRDQHRHYANFLRSRQHYGTLVRKILLFLLGRSAYWK